MGNQKHFKNKKENNQYNYYEILLNKYIILIFLKIISYAIIVVMGTSSSRN